MKYSVKMNKIARWSAAVAFAVMAMPASVLAQSYTCSSNLNMETIDPGPFYVNEPIGIRMTLIADDIYFNAGGVEDPNIDGLLWIDELDFKPDCDAGDFDTCAAAGNTVSILTAGDAIGGTCDTDFTITPVGDGVTYRLVPDADTLVLNANSSCTLELEVQVNAVAAGTTEIFETAGWLRSQSRCTEPDEPYTVYPGLAGGASADASVDLTLSSLRTAFRVYKDFTDDAELDADMYIQCNSGLPLSADYSLQDEGWVEFVVRDFVAGVMDCDVWEDPVPEGYEVSYEADNAGGDGIAGDWYADEDGCHFEDVTGGLFTCDVTNSMLPIDIEVNKVWEVSPESNIEVDYQAEAEYTCYNVYTSAEGTSGDYALETVEGTLYFDGATDTQTIEDLYAAADGSSYCTVAEPYVDDHVEADASDCEEVPVENGASCTIYNSVFFEGVPTLGQYGLALLSLLMLGMGVIAVRRFA